MIAGTIMSGRDFLDTNILLYALSDSAPAKHRVAQALVTRAIGGEFSISTQVLAEFAAVALSKFRDRLTSSGCSSPARYAHTCPTYPARCRDGAASRSGPRSL
jgi:predicted nucleic acid-binding protein